MDSASTRNEEAAKQELLEILERMVEQQEEAASEYGWTKTYFQGLELLELEEWVDVITKTQGQSFSLMHNQFTENCDILKKMFNQYPADFARCLSELPILAILSHQKKDVLLSDEDISFFIEEVERFFKFMEFKKVVQQLPDIVKMTYSFNPQRFRQEIVQGGRTVQSIKEYLVTFDALVKMDWTDPAFLHVGTNRQILGAMKVFLQIEATCTILGVLSDSLVYDPERDESQEETPRLETLILRLQNIEGVAYEDINEENLVQHGIDGELLRRVGDGEVPIWDAFSKLKELIWPDELSTMLNQTVVRDEPFGPDLMGIEPEAHALADAMADKNLKPPFVVGIMGSWGCGKSFTFMLIKERLGQILSREIKDDRDFPYAGHIYIVKFDAWTYGKGNLWASLMYKILMDLNDQLSLEAILRKNENVDLREGGYNIFKILDTLHENDIEAFEDLLADVKVRKAIRNMPLKTGTASKDLAVALNENYENQTEALDTFVRKKKEIQETITFWDSIRTNVGKDKVKALLKKAFELSMEDSKDSYPKSVHDAFDVSLMDGRKLSGFSQRAS